MKCILSISVAILLIASCKKMDVVQVTEVIPKVKTFTISNATTTLNSVVFEYDNNGRLATLTYANGNYIKCSYTKTLIAAESFNANGMLESKTNYILNEQGLVISYYNVADPFTDNLLTYNTAKQLESFVTVTNGEIKYQNFYTYNSDGNCIKDSIVNGSISSTRKYDYYTGKISTVENPTYGISMYGLPNKNCIKQSSLKVSTSSIINTDYSIPETDAQGRITKSIYTHQGDTYTNSYTYY